MTVELIQTTTRDGLRLDAAFQPGTLGRQADAFCLVHGTGSNFYGSGLLGAFADKLAQLGHAVLRINTRGHDLMCTTATTRGGRRLGAAYEVVDECRHDLAAWIDWLRVNASDRVVLMGHSLGAVKCLYALAHEPRLPVRAVVALSPPRLSYSWFCQSPEAAQFLATYQRAEACVRDNDAAALLEITLPLPMVITAAGYVEKYGPDERYNYLNFLRSVPGPVLVTLGDLEIGVSPAFRGAAEAIADLALKKPDLKVETIADADHFYTNAREQVSAVVMGWVQALG